MTSGQVDPMLIFTNEILKKGETENSGKIYNPP